LTTILKKFRIVGVQTEVQWSDLQRDPKAVAALTDAGVVRVRRRDGAALLLSREDRATSEGAGALTAARALRNALSHVDPTLATEILRDEFPWVDLLPIPDRGRFVTEFVRAVQASAEIGEWTALTRAIDEWKATAVVYADPALAAQLSGPLDTDHGAVPSPDEC
jgi:hypothetical protein